MSALVDDFRRFSDLFPEPILLLSVTGHLCAANERARQLLFQGIALAPEQHIMEFLGDDSEKVLKYLRACARSAQPLPGLVNFQTARPPSAFKCMGSAFKARDDRERPLVMWRLAPKAASTNRFEILNQQINQLRSENARRLQAERLAREQQQLLQVTLASIGDAVIATDLHGRVTFMNAVAEAHTGYTSKQSCQQPLEKIFVIRNEHTGEAVEDPVQRVLRTGGVVGLANHTVLIRSDGTELPIDDSAAPIRDELGQLYGVILVFHETSESRRLQRQLMDQTEALKEADRRKDQFLAVLAHELRNPLAPLRNGLQIAKMKAAGDTALQRTFDMMERQLVHLVRLINDLMDVSRVSRGVIELRRAPVYISDVVARSVESVRTDIEARCHEIQIDASSHDVAVEGDTDRLTQVFANLLMNSSKYTPNGGIIRVRVSEEATQVVIEVIDNGIGIPPDQLEHVFEMFSQVRADQGLSEGGLGIGLSLVRSLVGMHGGTVSAVSSGPGTGSTFAVRLPLASRVPTPIQPEDASLPVGQSLRVVVADDNEDSASSLRELLEAVGYQVRTARDGEDALTLVEQFRPELVFMDVGMPKLDGIEATRRIRERPYGKDIVIVALTGWGQAVDRERTRLAGADKHIVKPIGPDGINEVLDLLRQRGPSAGPKKIPPDSSAT